jgi:hypothetical protein
MRIETLWELAMGMAEERELMVAMDHRFDLLLDVLDAVRPVVVRLARTGSVEAHGDNPYANHGFDAVTGDHVAAKDCASCRESRALFFAVANANVEFTEPRTRE